MRPDGPPLVNGEDGDPLRRPCAPLGIDTVYRTSLVPTLSVAHNMFLSAAHGRRRPDPLAEQPRDAAALKYIDDIGISTLRSVNAEVAMLPAPGDPIAR